MIQLTEKYQRRAIWLNPQTIVAFGLVGGERGNGSWVEVKTDTGEDPCPYEVVESPETILAAIRAHERRKVAAMAMQGTMSNPRTLAFGDTTEGQLRAAVVRVSVEYADALLVALAEEGADA